MVRSAQSRLNYELLQGESCQFCDQGRLKIAKEMRNGVHDALQLMDEHLAEKDSHSGSGESASRMLW